MRADIAIVVDLDLVCEFAAVKADGTDFLEWHSRHVYLDSDRTNSSFYVLGPDEFGLKFVGWGEEGMAIDRLVRAVFVRRQMLCNFFYAGG